jgi:hypothetical protein
MCNLHNVTTNQEAIRRFIGIMQDRVGNHLKSADWKEAEALQRPLTDDGLTIVVHSETTDQGRLLG